MVPAAGSSLGDSGNGRVELVCGEWTDAKQVFGLVVCPNREHLLCEEVRLFTGDTQVASKATEEFPGGRKAVSG